METTQPRDLEQYPKTLGDPSFHVEFDDDNAYAARENWGNALVEQEENKEEQQKKESEDPTSPVQDPVIPDTDS
ncbi:hypothetical protein MRB53_030065 [Persea americana]|uniref:Uncharacterized protein n=1 Tax=Persea americana TaxID=3435 RepID=A0ACC2KK51_PERAE|nr:hypothetical protein MRB53_030065 [Persea americana]